MMDNNVTEGNYVLVFRNIVFTICYKQITYFFFVCYIVARNLNFQLTLGPTISTK